MKRHVRLTTLLVLGLINITVALADAEHDARARITHELHALEPLAMRAETNAQQDARSHFRYDWLYQDLEKINDDTELQIESPQWCWGFTSGDSAEGVWQKQRNVLSQGRFRNPTFTTM